MTQCVVFAPIEIHLYLTIHCFAIFNILLLLHFMKDDFKHKGLRLRLVNALKSKGIRDIEVLNAIARIPRHLFVESYLENRAYNDEALPIGSEQTISQPYTVAFQSELLQIQRGEKVLEIGTGSGYQCVVLLELGAKVYSIERQKNIFHRTRELLENLRYYPYLVFGDGFQGLKTYCPFDKIIVTAGATEIPMTLLGQLKIGGRIVIPLGKGGKQIMTTIDRISTKEFRKKEHGQFAFVPMLKGLTL